MRVEIIFMMAVVNTIIMATAITILMSDPSRCWPKAVMAATAALNAKSTKSKIPNHFILPQIMTLN